MTITNEYGYTPNVLHFHGQNINELAGTFNLILNNHLVCSDYDKSRLKIVSTWTNEESCCLYKQCKKFNIPLVNCVPYDYDKTQTWYMPNKIKFFIDVLENTNEDIVMFLDGYDVLITHLDDIIERFENQPYKILFGPSCNNYPNIDIDKIYGRTNNGTYCYFNAGCVIGYREDLLKFYNETLQYINVKNPWNSEQFIMRIAFSKYSTDNSQTYIGIDYNCKIFQSMGVLNSTFNEDSIKFKVNRTRITNVLVIDDFFKDEYSFHNSFQPNKNFIFLQKIKAYNKDLLDTIFDLQKINYVIFNSTNANNKKLLSILHEMCNKYKVFCYALGNLDYNIKYQNIIAVKNKSVLEQYEKI